LAHEGRGGEILELDESCISNPKSEISDWTGFITAWCDSQFRISGFEMQDSSNFKISLSLPS